MQGTGSGTDDEDEARGQKRKAADTDDEVSILAASWVCVLLAGPCKLVCGVATCYV